MTDLGTVLAGDSVGAARALLGRLLVTEVDDERTAVVITEVEAYGGSGDPASHAARGTTTRNRSMFAAPGTLYVYRSYGLHWCINVVTGPEGKPSAVLLRAGAPVEGIAVMTRRRARRDHLADGPGKLAQALGVTGEYDGSSVYTGPVRVEGAPVSGTVTATPRIGITRGLERPWRFVLAVPESGPGAPSPDDPIRE